VFGFAARGSVCMACGVDLWDVERYLSAGSVVICESCVELLNRAVNDTNASGEIEVRIPVPAPRVHGPVPGDDAVPAITKAFVRTFDSNEDRLDDDLEDATELGALLAQARTRGGPAARFSARVDGIRFRTDDVAEVRYQILMNGNPMGSFQGSAARHDDGHWRVTRQTVARLLGNYGVQVPPRRS
jgi:hypothetical protein